MIAGGCLAGAPIAGRMTEVSLPVPTVSMATLARTLGVAKDLTVPTVTTTTTAMVLGVGVVTVPSCGASAMAVTLSGVVAAVTLSGVAIVV